MQVLTVYSKYLNNVILTCTTVWISDFEYIIFKACFTKNRSTVKITVLLVVNAFKACWYRYEFTIQTNTCIAM